MPPTSAKLTLNNFSKGGEGGAPSECDNQFHDNTAGCGTFHWYGCDEEHGNLPPCENNIVDGSLAVWEALSLDTKPS
ncbi:hypothetical protein L3X38_031433 [Prunus dulcis]|uniref:Uncharacterized protein n=1 Tax=Prunus dulcis TaxID=3755 RepID=A0AAD4VDA4_PRUDU|nr:hypothetical protein L3X38_031433 [Prunus dulcis]